MSSSSSSASWKGSDSEPPSDSSGDETGAEVYPEGLPVPMVRTHLARACKFQTKKNAQMAEAAPRARGRPPRQSPWRWAEGCSTPPPRQVSPSPSPPLSSPRPRSRSVSPESSALPLKKRRFDPSNLTPPPQETSQLHGLNLSLGQHPYEPFTTLVTMANYSPHNQPPPPPPQNDQPPPPPPQNDQPPPPPPQNQPPPPPPQNQAPPIDDDITFMELLHKMQGIVQRRLRSQFDSLRREVQGEGD